MIENMECARFKSRIDAYIDGEMQPFEMKEMEKHASGCPECARMLKEYRAVHELLDGIDDDVTVPPEVSAAWRDAVRRESMSGKKRGISAGTKTFRIIGGCVAAALALAIGINGIGTLTDMRSVRSGSTARSLSDGYYDGYDYDYEPNEYAIRDEEASYSLKMTSATQEKDSGFMVNGTAGSGAVLQSDGAASKDTVTQNKPVIIRSASRTVQSTSFDEDTSALAELVESSGGWFEYRSVTGKSVAEGGSGRTMDATVRIPETALDDFLGGMGSIGSVTKATDSAVDVSASYYDTAARLATLRAQHERLTELVTEAADLSDLLELEDKLYDVEYRIDSLEGDLADWDSRANYSEVSVTVSEVRVYTEPEYVEKTLWERVKEGFADSVEGVKDFLQGLVVLLAEFIPALVILIPAAVIVWLIVRVVKRRRARRG